MLNRGMSFYASKSKGHKALPHLFFMTDATRIKNPEAVIAALPTGSAIIIRDYDIDNRKDHAKSLIKLAKSRGLITLVAGDAKLARRVRADGLHLPEYMLWQAAPVLTGFAFVTASCHSVKALKRAAALGVDASTFSPIYPTRSHVGAQAVGVSRLSATLKVPNIPAVIALGGITRERLRLLSYLPLLGIAGISLFHT